jgi:hypothetical protein
MNHCLTPLGFLLGWALAAPVFADVDPTMTNGAYKASEDRIEQQYKTESRACDAMRNYDRDVCEALAEGKEKVTKAELDAKNKPGAGADAKVKRVQADAAYEVAKEKCADLRGPRKADCHKDARVVYDRTKSQAKFDKMTATQAARRAATKASAAKADAAHYSPSPRR